MFRPIACLIRGFPSTKNTVLPSLPLHKNMAVLAKDEILKAIDKKDIVITPYDPTAVGCARCVIWALPELMSFISIDLTLSNEFRYYKPGLSVIPINESTDYKTISEKAR
jgi:deoxycytidine triphosphate deaminase